MLTLLYCYASADVRFYKELDKHLIALKESGWIHTWYSQDMQPGTNREQEIITRLNVANVILLFISADFFASKLCMMEMKVALARHEKGEALVIPIMVRPVALEGTALQQLQALPEGNSAVTMQPSRDGTWQQIARNIRHAIEVMFPEIFIIAAPSDEPFAERLQHDLLHYGIAITSGNAEDSVRTNELHPALRGAAAVLLITSPNAPDSRQFKNYFDQAKLLKKRIVAVRSASEESSRTATEIAEENILIDACGELYEAALQAIVSQLRRQDLQQPSNSILPLPLEPRNPYKGLRAFSEADKDDFFGRDELIKEMMDILTQLLTEKPDRRRSSRLMAVVGASGSGKSSVVMAGLLPQLRNGALPGSKQWLYVDRFVPGEHPLEALALALARIGAKRDALAIQDALEGDSTRVLHVLATEMVDSTAMKMVLFIDQFEELFTQTTSEEERQHFIELLISAATDPQGPVIIILTLRADFFDLPMAYPTFSRLIQKHLVQVLPMDLYAVRATIEQPAALADVQIQFEAELVNELLFEMHGQTEALPLLQFTLEQLFQRRNGHLLTLQAYHTIGGVRGALAKQAMTTYIDLPTEEHRKQARRLFLRLIDLSWERKALRRRATLAELLSDNLQQDLVIRETLDAFVTARLLSANSVNGIQTYEVSHEALIDAWDQLANWLNEAREDVLLQHNLRRDIAVWKERHQPKDRLYRGQQLRETRAWAKRNQPDQQEAAFLRSSIVRQRQRRIISMSLILIPILVIGSIVQLIEARPTWCPAFFCPPPATNPFGSHDANLDVYFLGLQSTFYVIPGKQVPELNAIPSGTNAHSIGAVRLDVATPYRIAVQANRLDQGNYPIIIDQVACLIRKVQSPPQSLYVLSPGKPPIYEAFLYTVFYRLQPTGKSIVARTSSDGSQDLQAGESDQLDVQVISQVPADIQFQIQVTYHIAITSLQKTLTLPQTFEVIFAQAANWHEVSLSSN